MRVRVMFSGRRYDLGQSLPDELVLPEHATVDDALRALAGLLPVRLPDSCLVAVAGAHLGTVGKHREHDLRDGDELAIIAPVAGG